MLARRMPGKLRNAPSRADAKARNSLNIHLGAGPLWKKYVTLLYGWLRKRARWSESCVLIGYPSGQDGPILPARDCPLCAHHLGVIFWPNDKLFIDQACSVKMAGYWSHSFFLRLVHKNAKKKIGQYRAILTSRLVHNAYLLLYLQNV